MRVAIATLGCKVNQYDTAVMERLFHGKGWQRVGFDDAADAYVINSCTVTDRADADARRMARRARRNNPDSRVVMTGCYAQTSPQAVSRLDYVDYVVGLGRLPDLLSAVAGEATAPVSVSDLRREDTVRTLGISSFPGRTRAFVKIQEGCDLFCSFCIIPVARGRSRSVQPRQVLEEIERLAARGYREVVLTGVHLGGYGRDLDPVCDLPWLLEAISERGPALRVRISSLDPPEISQRLLDIVAADSRFCRHFHIPLQAGDDTVLDNMRRQYDTLSARRAIEMIRERIDDVCLGTDLITGFPGETEEQHENGLRFVRDLGLSYLHVFPYSQRSSTSAAKRWQPLADQVVHERAAGARALDRELRSRFLSSFVGKSGKALIETARDARTGLLKGYTDNYLPIVTEGPDHLMNSLVEVRMTGVANGKVEARVA